MDFAHTNHSRLFLFRPPKKFEPKIQKKHGIFWRFFRDIMANFGLIDFKLGLYIKVNVNTWQNKFEVHISKTWPKWPSIGTK